jgi:hypothetical protein
VVPAAVAFVLGVLYAALSAYWGLGGTALLDTIGGTLEREGRAGNAALRAVVWVTVVLKLTAALMGLMAVIRHRRLRSRQRLIARRAAWAAAAILVIYGGVLTVTGLLVQADVLHESVNGDQKAQRWHAFVWDPWFLVWGLVLMTALARSRHPRHEQAPPSEHRPLVPPTEE